MEAARVGAFFSAFMQENLIPQLTAMRLAGISDQGEFYLRSIILGDNDGVWRAVTAESPHTPTEPAFTPHARAYREILDTKQIKAIGWVANRDMVADPLTKGKTRRNNLNIMLNQGQWIVQNSTMQWPMKAQGPNSRSRL